MRFPERQLLSVPYALTVLAMILFTRTGHAAVSTPLTIQEMTFAGDQTGRTLSSAGGVARANEPFCMGVPIEEAAGLTDASTLQLSGVSAAQFRVLGYWPSGKVKWVEVCGLVPTLAAGSSATVTLSAG